MAAVLGVTLTAATSAFPISISTGNEAASGVEDYVDYLLDDPAHARVIGLIVEQFRRPRRFLELARSRTLPPANRSCCSIPAAAAPRAHPPRRTPGAMAGDYQVMRALSNAPACCVADTLEELGDVLELVLALQLAAPGRRRAVITDSGAFKALTLDLCEQIGLDASGADRCERGRRCARRCRICAGQQPA